MRGLYPVSSRLLSIAQAHPRWTRAAARELGEFIASQDRISLGCSGMPWLALSDAGVLKGFLAAGISLDWVYTGGSCDDARLVALVQDAPAAVHAVLDAAGIPPSPAPRAHAQLHCAIRFLRPNSFAYLANLHRGALGPGLGDAPSALVDRWARVEADREGRRALAKVAGMVRTAARLGVAWPKSDGYSAMPWYPRLEQEVLAAAMAPSQPAPTRPRL